MTQFSMGVLACQGQSHFAKAYNDGVHKGKYWESTFEDAIDVCAKVSRIAALVYHNSFGDVKQLLKLTQTFIRKKIFLIVMEV
jgi:citrate synthase